MELPDCPSSIENNVLRRVRLSKEDEKPSVWDWFSVVVPQPTFVAASLALVVVASAGITAMAIKSFESDSESRALATTALDFGVFQETQLLHFED